MRMGRSKSIVGGVHSLYIEYIKRYGICRKEQCYVRSLADTRSLLGRI